MKMKFCEYMANLLSLDILFKQVKIEKIEKVFVYRYNHSEQNILYLEGANDSAFIFRVEKEAHEPWYKVLGLDEPTEDEKRIDSYIKRYGKIPLMLEFHTWYYIYSDVNSMRLEEFSCLQRPYGVFLMYR